MESINPQNTLAKTTLRRIKFPATCTEPLRKPDREELARLTAILKEAMSELRRMDTTVEGGDEGTKVLWATKREAQDVAVQCAREDVDRFKANTLTCHQHHCPPSTPSSSCNGATPTSKPCGPAPRVVVEY